MSRNVQKSLSVLFLIGLQVILVSCSTVPVTGRRQLSLVPASTLNSMSSQSYGEFLTQHKLSDDPEATQMVERIGRNIQRAVEEYFAAKNMPDQLNHYDWQFNVVEDPAVNAWCMPGGRVVVYTGILPVTENENGLAVVMGHEIAHAVANHGRERMSQGLVTELGAFALSKALEEKPAQTRNLFMKAYGAGTEVGLLLPYSRRHESEADHLGLIFMAMAGYDPNAAVDFWQRMAAASGASPPELLSTHPSDERRIEQIRELLPEAMQYYEK